MVKVKVSRYCWSYFCLMTAEGVLGALGLIGIMIYSEPQDRLIFLYTIIAWVFGILIAITIPPMVYYATIEIGESVIRSLLFGRLKCEIDMSKTTFYAIFVAHEGMFKKNTFIAISNEPFFLKRCKKEETFITSHDKTKQIICPLDERTRDLFPLEAWTRMKW